MELENPSNGQTHSERTSMELENPSNGQRTAKPDLRRSVDEIESNCSTPYASAPSSPGRCLGHGGYYFSAPASPMHFVIFASVDSSSYSPAAASGSADFEFSSKNAAAAVSTADELFLNGQIRPIDPRSSLFPLSEDEESGAIDNRSGSLHMRTRSMSPTRKERFGVELALDLKGIEPSPPSDSSSASSSRSSSSSGRNSKRWIFLKDLLNRSKGEGVKDKFWRSISFSPYSSKVKSNPPSSSSGPGSASTAQERQYATNKAVEEERTRRTFPYRQEVIGCLGVGSRSSYGTWSGLAKFLNNVR